VVLRPNVLYRFTDPHGVCPVEWYQAGREVIRGLTPCPWCGVGVPAIRGRSVEILPEIAG